MSTLGEAIEACRVDVIDVLQAIETLWHDSGLSHAPTGVGPCRKKLVDNVYKVLVVGEAKRGKSTFVNAVIGKDILPTDVDIATCQVFRVCRGEPEAYRIRYEDGSAERIELADIPKYGSQGFADTGKMPAMDEIVRWIEVDVPVRFLPPEIELLDTPGLGSLYAGHAEIIHRFIPIADAVIFVLTSNHPVSDVETEFLEQITEVTRHVFFIQTMIDMHRRADWEAIQQRNEAILREKFGNRLDEVKVWPVSSTSIQKAAATGDDDYLRVSRFPELVSELQKFLFRASGWGAMAEGILSAKGNLAEAIETLGQRRQLILEESNTKRTEHRERVMTARRAFEEAWGPRSSRRQSLLSDIQRHADLARQSFQQAMHPTTGGVAKVFQERIDALQSLADVKAMAATINEEVFAASCNAWRRVCATAQSKARDALLPFVHDVRPTLADPSSVNSSALMNLPEVSAIESRYFDRVKAGVFDARTASMAVAIPLVAAAWLFPPLLPIAIGGAAIAFLAGGIHGSIQAVSREVFQAKQQLKAHLACLLQNVQQRFFAVEQESGRYSIVDEFCKSYVAGIAKSITDLANEKQSEVEAELKRLDEEARMTEQQRAEEGRRLASLLARWKEAGSRLDGAAGRLQNMDEHMASIHG